jgi:hypothetical protein
MQLNQNEYFTVGMDQTGRTTLSIGDATRRVTLSMERAECERLIRMLKVTIEDPEIRHNTTVKQG